MLTDPTTISVTGATVAINTPFHITLAKGWNIISTPWRTEVDWADSRISITDGTTTIPLSTAISNQWTEGVLYSLDPATETYTALQPNDTPVNYIYPWQGYLLFSMIYGELIMEEPPPDNTYPVVIIHSPIDGTRVSLITDIIGTVEDDNLAEWRLEYESVELGQPITLATGEDEVTNATIGELDPTLLLNGMVNLRLIAEDIAGNISSDEKTVLIDGANKLGVFRISFVDLEVPVSGIPITIKRNYDSRVRTISQDFGYGWWLEVGVGRRYMNNRKPGDGWEFEPGPLGLPCSGGSLSTKYHATEVRFSDREFYRFALQVSNPVPTEGGCFGTASFIQIGGIPGATLAIQGNNEVMWYEGSDQLFDTDGVFEPQKVTLTTMDGTQYFMDISSGLEKMRDLNGNELTITSNGVTHNSGKGIIFTRDTAGRIMTITDPMNKNITYQYTPEGDLDLVTNRDDKKVGFTYKESHFIEDILDGYNNTAMTVVFDEDGRVVKLIDAGGNETNLAHDPQITNGSTITNRLGKPTEYQYDANGYLSDVIDALGNITHYENDDRGNVLSETNPLGHTTSYDYDPGTDNLLKVTDPLNHSSEYAYNDYGSILTIKDAKGNITENTYYTGTNNLHTVTDAIGYVTSYIYYPNGNLWTETDAKGNVTTHEYDNYSNLTKTTDALGNIREYGYDNNSNQTSSTVYRTVNGVLAAETSISTYNNSGQLLTHTDPLGNPTTYTYDNNGRQETITDALGRTIRNEYNTRGYLEKIIYPDETPDNPDDNLFEMYGHDLEGQRTSQVDRAGYLTTFEYDDLGRLWRTYYPPKVEGDPVAYTENKYDNAGRLEWVQNERGYKTYYEYDNAGRRTKVTDALGNETISEYEDNGNLKSVTDANGNTTTYVYDADNRHTHIYYPNGYYKETVYDELGRRITEYDEERKAIYFAYDELGHLIKVTDAMAHETNYSYDEVGNQLTQTDANNHTTSFTYDALGRRLTRTLPLGQVETMVYDAIANLQSKTDFNGHTITYEYNVCCSQLKKKIYPDNAEVSFTYAPNGQRETATDSRGVTSYEYYPRGWLKKVTDPNGWFIEYDYDLAGNRTSLTTTTVGPSSTTTYTFDELNRLQTVTDPQGGVTTYTYTNVGLKETMEYANGTIAKYYYDNVNQLYYLENLRSDKSVISSYNYVISPSGNRISVTENDGRIVYWIYDAIYRLTDEQITNPDMTIKTYHYGYG